MLHFGNGKWVTQGDILYTALLPSWIQEALPHVLGTAVPFITTSHSTTVRLIPELLGVTRRYTLINTLSQRWERMSSSCPCHSSARLTVDRRSATERRVFLVAVRGCDNIGVRVRRQTFAPLTPSVRPVLDISLSKDNLSCSYLIVNVWVLNIWLLFNLVKYYIVKWRQCVLTL